MNGEELKRLTLHKYSAVDTSYLDELCMKKFWDRLVQYYPMWLAPNLITLIGKSLVSYNFIYFVQV